MSSNSNLQQRGISEVIGVYQKGPEIGRGSFATVYKCIDIKTHKSVAIKSVVRSKLKSKKLLENLEIEVSILKTMKHPHIVGLLDYHQTSSHFHLVMDYCSMGDLSYFIRRRNQLIKTHPVISSLLERYPSPEGSHGLNEKIVLHFLKQLSSALQFLRDKSLVHRDIKPQNLLLCPPVHSKKEFNDGHFVGLWEMPILKIADFGFARFLPSTSMAETLCGSPLYMAPEILRYEKYNAKADLWSVGAVLYEMTVGKPPFKAGNHIELLKNIEKAHDKIKFPSSAQVPEPLKDLIRSLLRYNPTERVSFNEFFNDILITQDMECNDMPLETSDMDENLFISEYISPMHPTRGQNTNTITSSSPKLNNGHENEEMASATTMEKETRNSREVSPETTRDEQIKNIIINNSPGPDTVQKGNPSRNFEGILINNHFQGPNNNDAILEKGYVVVEKRAVEVNAIADELAHAGSGAAAITPNRYGTVGNMDSVKTTGRRLSLRSNSSNSQRRPSFTDRRISISISPSNALSKAIGLASNRLFGSNVNGRLVEEESDRKELLETKENASFSAVINNPNFANNLLIDKLNIPTSTSLIPSLRKASSTDEPMLDEIVLRKLESIATKAHSINLFADVKFSQLIPSPPSIEGIDDDLLHQNDMLPPRMVRTISEEGVALYVKTLSCLAKGMTVASDWWYHQYDREDSGLVDTDSGFSNRQTTLETSVKINELVQWIREKFNECLERAEFIKLRLEEANSSLNREYEMGNKEGFTNSKVALEPIESNKVMAEKLIFDRALEMSRNAAVNELVKEDLKGCELAYSTSIWMLEALLDDDEDNQNFDVSSNDEKLDNEDKAMVEKFIVSIGNRLSVLKKKLELI
ncbi:Pkinase-domain-containing protein [Suhomyces tanzawaensis NRRL Y-17324]|uniref:Serine/threonine-protein kinase ATG1 n=1 Tax=Suhomyces tanzawaensis NRRL Y-17324 TaxID=984487 RepID=A0A1E4SE98_9ASCO|nr:Pkinase-domain-containing protein [Suhomyces tanzawaensis NRRL Y-17324]ODV77800.1 Pkinase-domain-containing protein [Suhomyces tanzawaensis NRRL Y-17324]